MSKSPLAHFMCIFVCTKIELFKVSPKHYFDQLLISNIMPCISEPEPCISEPEPVVTSYSILHPTQRFPNHPSAYTSVSDGVIWDNAKLPFMAVWLRNKALFCQNCSKGFIFSKCLEEYFVNNVLRPHIVKCWSIYFVKALNNE